jgi:hypothetical protein
MSSDSEPLAAGGMQADVHSPFAGELVQFGGYFTSRTIRTALI